MKKNIQRFIKRMKRISEIVSAAVLISSVLFAILKICGVISDVLFIACLATVICGWWIVHIIKYFAEHKLINELKKWAQHVVDTNYYKGQQIKVECRNGIWFSGPADYWFRKKFIKHCRELCGDTGMKIFYNYSWIMM